MAMKVKELIAYLQGCDPDEIIIGQIFQAQDFSIETPDGEKNPSQAVMEKVDPRFEADGITQNTWEWLSDLVHEEAQALGEEVVDE